MPWFIICRIRTDIQDTVLQWVMMNRWTNENWPYFKRDIDSCCFKYRFAMQLLRNRSVERAQVVLPVFTCLLLCCIGTGIEWYSYSISFTTPYATSSYSLSMKLFQVCSPDVCRDYPIDSAKIQAAQAFAVMSCLALGVCLAASV